MVCDLEMNNIDHRVYRDIEEYLERDDILVVNDSRVIPARIKGRKTTGGKAEVLFLNAHEKDEPIEALIKGRVREDTVIIPETGRGEGGGGGRSKEHTNSRLSEATLTSVSSVPGRIKILRHISEGRFEVEVKGIDSLSDFLDHNGEMPVPPYIRKPLEDREEYQTVYSDRAGSIAAPTAGLHFTESLLDKLKKKGVRILPITLHVSIGTFLPVRENDIRKHTMEPEYFILSDEVRDILSSGEEEVVGVGTTVVKTLESVFHGPESRGEMRTEGWSNLFIYPGHTFLSPLKGMLTNFHLPASTLIMLVSAYAGRDNILRYYEEAVRERYRFYSFGDAMFLKGRPRG